MENALQLFGNIDERFIDFKMDRMDMLTLFLALESKLPYCCDCHQILSSHLHSIAKSLHFYLERKGKFSKFWPYILTLPKSHPTLLSEWPSKYVNHLPAVFRRNYWFRVRELGQRYDKINKFYHYYTNPANPNQVSMPGCTRIRAGNLG